MSYIKNKTFDQIISDMKEDEYYLFQIGVIDVEIGVNKHIIADTGEVFYSPFLFVGPSFADDIVNCFDFDCKTFDEARQKLIEIKDKFIKDTMEILFGI